MKQIIWSHSKLNCILKNPAEYNLIHNYGILPKFEKESLSLGSAIHWGIEHNTTELEDFYGKKVDAKKDELITAKCMVSGYLKHKDFLFKEILKENELIEEIHELRLYGKLPSKFEPGGNSFVGIIDLLLLTDKGFIVVDYKTSSSIPDWNQYLDQLYRYIFLLKENFPDTPVYKIAIINLRKSKIKRKSNENDNSFKKRLDVIYQLNDEKHIDSHVFKANEINISNLNDYIKNLAIMCDAALSIINHNCYYINYQALEDYGGSPYKELLLNKEGCYNFYKIKDYYFDDLDNEVKEYRDMREVDLEILQNRGNCSNLIILDRYNKWLIEFGIYLIEGDILFEELKDLDCFNLVKENFTGWFEEKYSMKMSDSHKDLIKNYFKVYYLLNLKEK